MSSATVSSTTDNNSGIPQQKYRFKKASTDEELDQLSGKKFALNTDRKISWAVDLYCDWRKKCMLDPECPTEILWCSLEDPDLNKAHLCQTLCCFVNEV